MIIEKPLTAEKFELLVNLSKSKMQKMVSLTSNIEKNIFKKLYPEQEGIFLQELHDYIISFPDKKIAEAREKKLYLYGWFMMDAYFLANFKAIYPIVKFFFYDKGVTTYGLRNNYSSKRINSSILSLCGNDIRDFMQIFNDMGRKYYEDFLTQGIRQNITFKKFSGKGLSKSVMQDILGKMRTFSTKK